MVGGWSSSSSPSPSPSPSQQPCASCKLLRRRCVKECIFAPYFPPDDPLKFAIVHKVFGASNVSKMLQELPVHQRADAVSSLVYEADARKRDLVYGCVGAISCLQNQVSQLQMQLAAARAEILCMQMQMQQQQRDQDQSTSFSMAITNMNTESVHGRMQQLIRSAQHESHASARGLHRLDRSASNNNVIVLEPAAAALN